MFSSVLLLIFRLTLGDRGQQGRGVRVGVGGGGRALALGVVLFVELVLSCVVLFAFFGAPEFWNAIF